MEEIANARRVLDQMRLFLTEIEFIKQKKNEICEETNNDIQKRMRLSLQLEVLRKNDFINEKVSTFVQQLNTTTSNLINKVELIQKEMKNENEILERELKELNEKCKGIGERIRKEEECLFVIHQWNKGKQTEVIYDSDIEGFEFIEFKRHISSKGKVMFLFEGNENNLFGISCTIDKNDYMGIIMDKEMRFYGLINTMNTQAKWWKNSTQKDVPKLFIQQNPNYLFKFGGWEDYIIIGHLNKMESKDDYGITIGIHPKYQFIGTLRNTFVIERIVVLTC